MFCSHCLLVTIVRNHLHYYHISVIALTVLLVWQEEGYDLLHNLWRAVQINDALVDAHLVAVPGLGALTTGGFAGGDAQNLGGHAHRSLDLQLFVLCALDQVCAHCTHIQHCEYRPTLYTQIFNIASTDQHSTHRHSTLQVQTNALHRHSTLQVQTNTLHTHIHLSSHLQPGASMNVQISYSYCNSNFYSYTGRPANS